jgi:hypothetical protein
MKLLLKNIVFFANVGGDVKRNLWCQKFRQYLWKTTFLLIIFNYIYFVSLKHIFLSLNCV